MGFAMARALLGFGEGVTFPGGLRTAVESLPASKRARAIALSFSGGTLGGVAAPLIAVPIGIRYGWRAAFLFTGALGLAWMVLWFAIARPPFLPKTEHRALKLAWPNPLERRFWAIVFSYALPAIAPGPILTLFSVYLNQGLGVSQADLTGLLWVPPLAWGVGYFFWGWAADRYAVDNRRPVGMFLLLTACALVLGFTTLDDVGHGHAGDHLVFGVHRRRLPDGRAESRLVLVSARTGGDDDGDRVGIVGAGEFRPPPVPRPAVQPAPVRRSVVADRPVPRGRRRGVAVPEPRSRAGSGSASA